MNRQLFRYACSNSCDGTHRTAYLVKALHKGRTSTSAAVHDLIPHDHGIDPHSSQYRSIDDLSFRKRPGESSIVSAICPVHAPLTDITGDVV